MKFKNRCSQSQFYLRYIVNYLKNYVLNSATFRALPHLINFVMPSRKVEKHCNTNSETIQ